MGNDVVKREESSDVTAAGDRMLALIRTKFPDYHPILAIAEIAHDKDVDVKVKLDCHKTLIRYVTPELKSIEVKAQITESRRVIVSLFGEGELFENGSDSPLPAQPLQATKPDPLWAGLEFEDAEEVA